MWSEGSAILLGAAIALWMAIHAAQGEYSLVAFGVVGLFAVAWTFLARETWWIILPVAAVFGGRLNFGFKLYTNEIALLLCLLPLIPMAAMHKSVAVRRSPVPRSVYLLLGYVLLHCLINTYLALEEDLGGFWNIQRVYSRAVWPLVFAIAFYRHGNVRYLRHTLILMYTAAFLANLIGAFGYGGLWGDLWMQSPIVLPGMIDEGFELRTSGLWLAYLSVAFLGFSKTRAQKLFHLAMTLLSGCFIFMGGSRASFGMFLTLVVLLAAFQRRWVMLVSLVALITAGIAGLNLYPDAVKALPFRVQRTVSVVVLDNPYHDLHLMAEGSDLWHYSLTRMGAERWLRSPLHVCFGNRLYPHPEMNAFAPLDPNKFWDRMWAAAEMGYYESGLWATLAVLGGVCMTLYIVLFWALLRDVVPVVWREGISDYPNVVGFLAISSLCIWVVFSWIAGHFPSEPLMLAVIARVAILDRAAGAKSAKET